MARSGAALHLGDHDPSGVSVFESLHWYTVGFCRAIAHDDGFEDEDLGHLPPRVRAGRGHPGPDLATCVLPVDRD